MSTFTLSDYAAVERIVTAAERNAKVAWVNGDTIAYGHARSLGTETGGFACRDEDIRSLFLRITTRNGMEIFVPVTDLMEKTRKDEFAIYDWS